MKDETYYEGLDKRTKEYKEWVASREEAIAKLKEAKDLLDLEMMSQEEYDKIKAELTPIIMGGK